MIKRCTACGEPHYFPRSICPFCFSDKTVWEESSGEATIYTYSLMRKSPTGPYAIAYVTLKEGPSLQTNIVDCDLEKLKIGQKVKVVFKPTDGAPLPFSRRRRIFPFSRCGRRWREPTDEGSPPRAMCLRSQPLTQASMTRCR